MDRNQSVGTSVFKRDVRLPEHRREADGRHPLLREGAPPLRQLVDPLPVRGRESELPGPRRAEPPGQPIPPTSSRRSRADLLVHSGVPLRQPQRSLRSQRRASLLHDRAARRRTLGGTDSFVKPLLGTIELLPAPTPEARVPRPERRGGIRRLLRRQGHPDLRAVPDRRRAEPPRFQGAAPSSR